MTATVLQTTTATTSTDNNHGLQSPVTSLRRSWACNSCHISFDNGQAQRDHMKCPWHVYNLKRRMASLPPISLAIFNDQVQAETESPKRMNKKESIEKSQQDVASPRQCLFCHQKFDDDVEGLEANLEHMCNTHGLFIPDKATISDLESFLGYLATEVRTWHECLYCGTTRNTTPAIQSHMRDRDHCKLNFEREPELSEFWEERPNIEAVQPTKTSNNELSLSPGKTATSRLSHQRRVKAARVRGSQLALIPTSSTLPHAARKPKPPLILPQAREEENRRQLVPRHEMGIQNIGPQQRQALVLAVKRSQKIEAVASRASEWSYARKANKQKHDQAHGPLSWAKGGMHNLLPR